MAIPFLNNIDLKANQILNARLQNLASEPAIIASTGGVFYNTAVNRIGWHDGTQWNYIYPGSSLNVANTFVLRDSSGNFTANIITATLNGNASTSTALLNARNFAITGKATASGVGFDGTANVSLNVTALSVVPADITLSNGLFIVGNGANVGAAVAKNTIPLSGFGAAAADVGMGGFKITNLADPANPQEAATKAYVDAQSQGLDPKAEARVATTANLVATRSGNILTFSANGAITIDGTALSANDRVLVKNQTTGQDNGIYTVTVVGNVSTPGQLTRAADADSTGEVNNGMFVFVVEGSTNASSGWFLTTPDPITLNTTPLTFVKFSAAGQIEAGAGLVKTGNTLDVGGTLNRITVNVDSVDIASTYVGQTSITTLGTIITGVWNGTVITVPFGGTGASSLAQFGVLVGQNTSAVQSVTASTAGQLLLSQTSANPSFVTMSGDATINSAGSVTIQANTVTYAKFQDVAGLSVLGRPTTGAGDPSSIAASTANSVLRVNSVGTALGWGAIDLASSNAVSGILSAANGGTSSAFFQVLGLTALRQMTFKNQNANIPAIFSLDVGDGVNSAIVITHNLNTRDIAPVVKNNSAPYEQVFCDVEATSTTTATLRFSQPPTSNQYRVTLVGF